MAADTPDPIEARLRRSLDEVAATQDPPGDWDALVARHHAPTSSLTIGAGEDARRPERRRLLAVAAAVLAVLAVGAVVATRSDDHRPAGLATDSSTPTDPPTTATTTPATTAPAEPAPSPGDDPAPTLPLDVRWEDLPDQGLLTRTSDGDVRVLDLDGAELATTRSTTFAAPDGPVVLVAGSAADGAPTVALGQHPVPIPAPAGCVQPSGYLLPTSTTGTASTTGASDDLRASVCGTDAEAAPQEIWLTEGAESSVVGGPPPGLADPEGRTAGHWREATPSPDGRWVLGQWSGECESPSAWFIPTDGGEVVPAEASTPESYGLGWGNDGRAIVAFTEGICGSGIEEPGVYAVDPATQDATLLVASTSTDGPQVWLWTKGIRAAPELSPQARDGARHSVEQLLAELRAGDLPGAATYWTGYPDVAAEPVDHRAVAAALATFADDFAWLLADPEPEVTAVASAGPSTSTPVVVAVVDLPGGGRRAAAFVVGGEQLDRPRPVLRLPTAAAPVPVPAEGTALAPGQAITLAGVPVEGGARAHVNGIEVPVTVDVEAMTTTLVLPEQAQDEVVITVSRATPEVPEAFAWWFPIPPG